jgi:hypothetical protein
MSCTGTSSCACGCCAGTSVQTPQMETNPPGQSSLTYRAGTWATFKESMLARLSSSDYPALGALKTRDDDDFTIAFLDATSVVLDILTFYQERLANESFLRTAVQQQSLIELSRLIGYQPSPGVSASTYVAFTLKSAPGQPANPSNPAITIPQGTQVQSVPGQGQTPQTFETSTDILAKSDWNALDVQTGQPWVPPGTSGMYLSGTATQLKLGDSLLILGVDRELWAPGSPIPSEQWDMVVLNQVVVDNIRQVTYVAWDSRLTHESGDGTSGDPSLWAAAKVFAFRQRAALFGNNAPNPNLFVNAQNNQQTSLPLLIDDTSFPWQWNNFKIASAGKIDLDATWQKIVVGSWFALTSTSAPTQLLVLGNGSNLWLEQAPLGSLPQSSRIAVDSAVYTFQAVSASQIFVLANNGNLWLEQAPFGSVPPSRLLVDENLYAFQALSASQVFVLGDNGNLWLEQAPFGSVPPARLLVDETVQGFQALSASQVYVQGEDGNLWLEQAPFGSAPPSRLHVDGSVQAFQAFSASQVLVLGDNGNLWLEQAPFGSAVPARVQVDQNVTAFQGLSASLIFVLDIFNNLWLEEAPFGNVPPSRVQVDQNVWSFQALSATEVLVVDLSKVTWLEYGPFGNVVPPARVQFDASEAEPAPADVAQLFKVRKASTVSLASFGLSGKVTELAGDYADPDIGNTFQLQATQVWGQSEQLTIAEQPLDYPLYGSSLDLHDLRPDLAGVTVVSLSGNRQKIAVADGITGLVFTPDDISAHWMTLNPGDVLTVTDPSPLPLNADGSVPDWPSSATSLLLYVQDSNGRTGTVQASPSDFTLAESGSTDPIVGEYALVTSVSSVTHPYPHTLIVLQSNLQNCYDRYSTTVNANVGLATQGQSVAEIMGSGSASTPNQNFNLKQTPLTFVQAPTPTGRQSTLQVQANGTVWSEVPSLYQQGPSQQVFATLNQPGGNTEVLFGDGVEGSTLPTGQNNILANYRIGLGSAGNVAAGAVSSLIDRPLGVSGVINRGPATGGQNPDSIDDIRANAPQTVMTLGRAVSITDYQSYASTFAGISKAYSLWIPSGPARGVFLTVAGVGGAALLSGNPTLNNLTTSLQNYGNPLVPLTVITFLETLFGLTANLQYAANITTNAAQLAVQAQVLQALYAAFSFAQRTFGQGVSADEVAAVIQGVPGVVAVNVIAVTAGPTSSAGDLAGQGAFTLSGYNNWLSKQVTLIRPVSGSPTRICAYLPVASPVSAPSAAEILVLDPDPGQVVLGVMS